MGIFARLCEALLAAEGNGDGGPTWETLQRRRLFVLYLLWPLVVVLAIVFTVAAFYLHY